MVFVEPEVSLPYLQEPPTGIYFKLHKSCPQILSFRLHGVVLI